MSNRPNPTWVSHNATITVQTNPNYSEPLTIRMLRDLFERACSEGATDDSVCRFYANAPGWSSSTAAEISIRATAVRVDAFEGGPSDNPSHYGSSDD